MSITIGNKLVINNGMVWSVTSKSSDYTTTAAEYVINVDASSDAVTISLADGLTVGTVYYINKIDSSTNNVTITPLGTSATINGDSNFEISTQYNCVTLYLGSTTPNLWYIV